MSAIAIRLRKLNQLTVDGSVISESGYMKWLCEDMDALIREFAYVYLGAFGKPTIGIKPNEVRNV